METLALRQGRGRCWTFTLKPEPESNQSQPDRLGIDETAACDRCGRFGALSIGERKLCPDCREQSGSCCPEFGQDDLWAARDDL